MGALRQWWWIIAYWILSKEVANLWFSKMTCVSFHKDRLGCRDVSTLDVNGASKGQILLSCWPLPESVVLSIRCSWIQVRPVSGSPTWCWCVSFIWHAGPCQSCVAEFWDSLSDSVRVPGEMDDSWETKACACSYECRSLFSTVWLKPQ